MGLGFRDLGEDTLHGLMLLLDLSWQNVNVDLALCPARRDEDTPYRQATEQLPRIQLHCMLGFGVVALK